MRFAIVVLMLGLSVMMSEAICPCPKIYMPVCASNGRTYNNPCELECIVREARETGNDNAEHSVYMVHSGRCSSDPEAEQKEDDFFDVYE